LNRLLLVLGLALATVGCGRAPVKVSFAPPSVVPAAKAYVDLLKRWTRHGHVIEDFDEALTVDATLHSPEFRAVFIEKWLDVYKIAEGEAPNVRTQMTAEVADMWEFHIESAAHVWDVDNFQFAKKVWRVSLVDDKGRELVPQEAKLDKTRREVIVEFYPYAGIFSRAWRLRFPRNLADGTPFLGPDTKSVTLRFAGPKGNTDLTWQIQ
jgi:hypothetical protein